MYLMARFPHRSVNGWRFTRNAHTVAIEILQKFREAAAAGVRSAQSPVSVPKKDAILDRLMRLLIYNIRYGTGGKHRLLPWTGYLRRTGTNLERIIAFIGETNPDIAGLIEVDEGSYRSGRRSQAESIAAALGHYHTYRSKYAENSVIGRLPLMSKQGNAFLSRDTISGERFHYFTSGVKRLVIELELAHVTVFLVHLALKYRIRQNQLTDLYELVKKAPKPAIVAGDFNVFWGNREIGLFMGATGLATANPGGLPSFPSWAPNRQLDFILHSPAIRSTGFQIPPVEFSDHLPLVWDFEPA